MVEKWVGDSFVIFQTIYTVCFLVYLCDNLTHANAIYSVINCCSQWQRNSVEKNMFFFASWFRCFFTLPNYTFTEPSVGWNIVHNWQDLSRNPGMYHCLTDIATGFFLILLNHKLNYFFHLTKKKNKPLPSPLESDVKVFRSWFGNQPYMILFVAVRSIFMIQG